MESRKQNWLWKTKFNTARNSNTGCGLSVQLAKLVGKCCQIRRKDLLSRAHVLWQASSLSFHCLCLSESAVNRYMDLNWRKANTRNERKSYSLIFCQFSCTISNTSVLFGVFQIFVFNAVPIENRAVGGEYHQLFSYFEIRKKIMS